MSVALTQPKNFQDCVKRARQDVADLDETFGNDRDLKTICMALITGLRKPETGSHYDALVMLADITGMDLTKYE